MTPRGPNNRTRYRAVLAVAATLVALPACRHDRPAIAPPVALPRSRPAADAAWGPRWWTAFNDAQLNASVDRALRENFTLRTAWDRLDQARATASKSSASLWPALDASGGARRTVTHTAGPAGGTAYATELSLGLSASYEADLWGRIRSTVDAARLDADASEADLHTAAITLAADIARTWFRLIEQHGQRALLDEQLRTNETFLEVVTVRFRQGQVAATDVLQQRELVEQTRGRLQQVAATIAVLEHQLAVLTARRPGAYRPDVPDALPQRPPLPDGGVPVGLIRRRPDVRAAERRIQAADQRVWAAIADQYPKLRLTGSAETSAEQLRDLFDNWLASIAANLTAPLLDAGLRAAEVERTRAVLSERINTYGKTLLAALGEAQDALAREARQAAYVASLTEQLALSRAAAEQTRQQYIKGRADFTRYLTTRLSYQQLQRTVLEARRQLLGHRIDLYRALGRGWSLPRPPRATVSGETDEPSSAAFRPTTRSHAR
ncbi:MAG: efflux transporter outer membrane subunit [Phycisphaerae bacterium]|nr:efflux transporter outer membrane subunit [Phycisphaerae bacterium]